MEDINNAAFHLFSEDVERSHIDGAGAAMPPPARGFGAALDNQLDWLLFDGDIDDLLSSHPPTIVKQTKRKKTSHSTIPTKYEYCQCRCGCAYKLPIRTSYADGEEMPEIHYKEVLVSTLSLCFVLCFVTHCIS